MRKAQKPNDKPVSSKKKAFLPMLVLASILVGGYGLFVLAYSITNQLVSCGDYEAVSTVKSSGETLRIETISLRANNTGTATVYVFDGKVLDNPITTSFIWRMRYSRIDKWNVESNVPIKSIHVLAFENEDGGSFRQLYWSRQNQALYSATENGIYTESQLCYPKK